MQKRMVFDSQGRLSGVDNVKVDIPESEEEDFVSDGNLRTSDSLEFLKESKIYSADDKQFWSLYSDGKKFEPLKFSNGKTQEDVVREVVNLIKSGTKIVFIHGVCGTGKSAIALNIARVLGRASLVVPVKSLQRQYEEDYMGKKYVLKNGRKMKIAMISGRDNHDSIIKPGVSCNDPFLPDTIRLTEKNYGQIKDYYDKNPLVKHKLDSIDVQKLRRIAIAPANPYWSPIVSADVEMHLPDSKKKKYLGLDGKHFIFYHRKQGCSYYDQYQAYLDAETIIFNSAKYKIEVVLNRKPFTDVDIIDEADEFLDSFSTQEELNITRLESALQNFATEGEDSRAAVDSLVELLKLEIKNKIALGIKEDEIYNLKDTKLEKVLRVFLRNKDLEADIMADELSYASRGLEVAQEFREFIDDAYVTFRKFENDIVANIVSTNLSKRFQDIVKKNNALVLMSGTLHSPEVLRNIFGIEDFKIVEAETFQQGTIEIQRTGKEMDCRYSNFNSGKHTREEYLKALEMAIEKSKKPVLVHVNAFEDLPSEQEANSLGIIGVMSKERLKEMQANDKTGKNISLFKSKANPCLFTTKCSRGVDFPGDMCNSIVFTKYPNPNVRSTFWKILQKTHPNMYWDFYFDKARREFLQRIYRAVRSKDDHVFILSPDLRVLEAVRKLQTGNLS